MTRVPNFSFWYSLASHDSVSEMLRAALSDLSIFLPIILACHFGAFENRRVKWKACHATHVIRSADIDAVQQQGLAHFHVTTCRRQQQGPPAILEHDGNPERVRATVFVRLVSDKAR